MANLTLQPAEADAGHADTYIEQRVGQTTVNYGTADLLYCGFIYVGKTSNGRAHVLLRYDVSSLVGAGILDATLTLTPVDAAVTAGETYSAYRITQTNWTELGATWVKYDGATNWTAQGGDYDASAWDSVFSNDALPVVFDLTAAVVDAIENRGGILELLIRGAKTTGSPSEYYGFASSSYVNPEDEGDTTARPKLEINYVPVVSDTLSVSVTDSGAVTAIFTATDTSTVVLGETSAPLAIIGLSDSAAVSLADSSANAALFGATDTLAASVFENLLDLTITNPTFYAFNSSDSIAPGVAESASQVRAILDRPDSLSVSFAEGVALLAALSRTDSLAVAADGAAAFTALVARSDTLNLAAFGASMIGLAVEVARTDTLTASLGESTATLNAFTVTDDPAVAASDSAALLASLTRADSVSASLAEAAAPVVRFARPEALYVSLGSSVGILATGSAADSLGVAVADAVDLVALTGATDSVEVSADESVTLASFLARADTVAVSIADASAQDVTWYVPGALYLLPDARLHYSI